MKVIRAINHFCTWLCMFFIVALMLLMVCEVVLRSFFGSAILGATEWAAMLLVFELTAIGSSILTNRMVKVNMVTASLPKKAQVILDIVIVFICAVVIGFTAWRQFMYGMQSLHNGVKYVTIHLPQWPFIVLFAFGYAVAAVTSLSVVIRKIINACRGNWDMEAAIEDTDLKFAYGDNVPGYIMAMINGTDGKAPETQKTESLQKPAGEEEGGTGK